MKMFYYFYNHPFHLVTLSPWPLMTSLSLIIFMVGSMKMFTNMNYSLMMLDFYNLLICSYQWWRDVIRESTFQGSHTKKIYKLLKLGMILFIISLFWTYLHSSCAPSMEIGLI